MDPLYPETNKTYLTKLILRNIKILEKYTSVLHTFYSYYNKRYASLKGPSSTIKKY